MASEVQQWGALALSAITALISGLALLVCLRIKLGIAELKIQILHELQSYVRKEDCKIYLPHRQPACEPGGDPA